MEQNEIVALKKFMDEDLVDRMVEPRIEVNAKSKPRKFDSLSDVYVAYKQEQFEMAKPIPSLPDKDIRISQSGTVVLSPTKGKSKNRDTVIIDAMKTVVDAVEKIAARPINIEFKPEILPPSVTIQPANIEAPTVNIEATNIPAPVVNITMPESEPPIINIEPAKVEAPIINVNTKPADIPAPIVNIESSKDTSNVLSAIKTLVTEMKKSNKQKPPKVEVNVENKLMMPDHEVEIEKVVERDSLNRILRTISTRKIVKKD